MNGPDAMHSEMPGFLFPGRPGSESEEPLLDIIFDGRSLPPRAPQEMHDLARMLATAAGPAEDPSELAGEAAALAAFTRSVSPASVLPHARTPTRHRKVRSQRARWQAPRGRTRLVTALIAVMAALSGAATFTGVLQQVAHVTVSALAPSSRNHSSPQPSPHPTRHHDSDKKTQPAPAPGSDSPQRKSSVAAPNPTPTPHKPRSRTAPRCAAWSYGTPQPWNSAPAPTTQPRVRQCPSTPPPLPQPSRAAPVNPVMPQSTGLP
jgi:hypothetical protein